MLPKASFGNGTCNNSISIHERHSNWHSRPVLLNSHYIVIMLIMHHNDSESKEILPFRVFNSLNDFWNV